MSEEFKPVRITLSQEAFDRMERIMKDAAFRSYSSTIEECIRVVFDIVREIESTAGRKGDPEIDVPLEVRVESWNRILMRMGRFTERVLVPARK